MVFSIGILKWKKKICPFFNSKIYFENTILALFDKPTFTDGIVFNFFLWVDSWPKILLFTTHHLLNTTTELILLPSDWIHRSKIKRHKMTLIQYDILSAWHTEVKIFLKVYFSNLLENLIVVPNFLLWTLQILATCLFLTFSKPRSPLQYRLLSWLLKSQIK